MEAYKFLSAINLIKNIPIKNISNSHESDSETIQAFYSKPQ